MSEFTEQMKRAAEIGTVADMRLAIKQAAMLIDGQRTDLANYESQLDAQSANIEELKRFITDVFEEFNGTRHISTKTCLKSAFLLDKPPATSLEQVKREAKIEALQDYDACLSSFPITVEEYIANNLKEKG